MKMQRRIFVYSTVLMLVITGLFFGYTFFMLPQLYAANVESKVNSEVEEIHRHLLEKEEFIAGETIASGGLTELIIDEGKPVVTVMNMQGSAAIELQNEELKRLFFILQEDFRQADWTSEEKMEALLKKWKHLLEGLTVFSDLQNLVTVRAISGESAVKDKKAGEDYGIEWDMAGRDSMLLTGYFKDKGQEYQVKLAIGKKNGKIYVTYAPVMFGNIHQLLPTLYVSLPMMLAVLILLLLFISALFTRGIAHPLRRLVRKTGEISDISNYAEGSIAMERKDEIGLLSREMDQLYLSLKAQYLQLEKENRHKELLIRGASHQIKTPIAGALLLVNGIIDHVVDIQKEPGFLYRLRDRIISMQKIVERLLHSESIRELKDTERRPVDIRELTKGCLKNYEELGNMQVILRGDPHPVWLADEERIEELVDNLISNCYAHTEQPGLIRIDFEENRLIVCNEKAHIQEELLENITEAFVSQDGKKGHGLGLYLAEQAAKSMGFSLKLENTAHGVRVILCCPNQYAVKEDQTC